jgi:hypothetical protein
MNQMLSWHTAGSFIVALMLPPRLRLDHWSCWSLRTQLSCWSWIFYPAVNSSMRVGFTTSIPRLCQTSTKNSRSSRSMLFFVRSVSRASNLFHGPPASVYPCSLDSSRAGEMSCYLLRSRDPLHAEGRLITGGGASVGLVLGRQFHIA